MGRIRGAARVLRWQRVDGEQAMVLAETRCALQTAFGSAADGVSLRLHGGTLTIRGEVERLDEIALYETMVRRVPGVFEVDNLLRLRLAGAVRPHVLPA